MDCENSEKHKDGLSQWITCKVTGQYCNYMRYCPEKHSVINTEQYINCKVRKGQDERGRE